MATILIEPLFMSALPSVSDALPQVGALLPNQAMVWATLFFLGVTAWMIAVVFFVKWQQQRSFSRDQKLIATWEGLFFAAITGDEMGSLPAISRLDRSHVLKIWCHIANDVAGDALDRLTELGRRIGIDKIALAILVPGGLRLANPSSVEVLLALRAAERLRISAVWEPLKKLSVWAPPLWIALRRGRWSPLMRPQQRQQFCQR